MHNKLVAPHKVDRNTEHYAAVKAEMAKRGDAAALREKNTHACVTTLRADGVSGFCAECGTSL